MILGLSVQAFVMLHVAISLVGIATGLVALPALAAGRWLGGWNAAFLITTAATSITGFLFPIGGITPALVVGAISLVDLAIALVALYALGLRGRARIAYAVSATIALYFNLFVLVVQSFLKIPALQALAPTQTELPFIAAQSLVLAASVVLGATAILGSRHAAPTAA
ncbi:hypothetical protein CLG96_05895 [Sphingomonas oleivorans]|uniref:Uncharacterized protein n=1 Tax=Sphingomonas oleivorans TaxID=1735121 RepID=A0A2T5FZG6_9SPHN|nr:hypothetical protein [Sphingomonas oleivorans]PTQ12098.1 hypothetical protein CLG96_05895 [Sphingomonas oleivorans]